MRKFARYLTFLALWLLKVHPASGQNGVSIHDQDRINIQCDKYSCQAADTVWWKAYVFSGDHYSRSTILHVELFNDIGRLVDKEVLPIFNGLAIGQTAIPDSLPSGVYWLQFCTIARMKAGFEGVTTIPITVFHKTDKNIVVMKSNRDEIMPAKLPQVELQADTFNTATAGYNSWKLIIKGKSPYQYSCSVTNADLPAINELNQSDIGLTCSAHITTDTTFLQWSGRAIKESNGKPIKNSTLFVMVTKDNKILMNQVVNTDSSGRFFIDHLFFFGNAQLSFQLNKSSPNAKNVKLVLDAAQPPMFQRPTRWNKRDTLILTKTLIDEETIAQNLNLKTNGIVLNEVKIKGWRDPRKQLDSTYTSGEFSEPALWSFDLRNEKQDNDLASYLREHLPGFEGGFNSSDTPTLNGHGILFYVNEQLRTWDNMGMSISSIADIAYIKAFESDFIGSDPFTKWATGVGGFTLKPAGKGQLKIPVNLTPIIVSIYTRRGKDTKLPPGLNTATINGYSTVSNFRQGQIKNATLVWQPVLDAPAYCLRFTNSGTIRHFRITVVGFDEQGNSIFYTKVLPNLDKTNNN